MIELATPASLPFGLINYEDKGQIKTALLGLTVQHPPLNLTAQSSTGMQITGARANKAYEQAVQFLQYHTLAQQAEIEIEYAIPMFVGLGSDAMMGLGIAKTLAALHNIPSEKSDTLSLAQAVGLKPPQVLEFWGFEQGGLLLVGTDVESNIHIPSLLQRIEIDHPQKEAWAFVFYFSDIPDETPETLEADRMTALLQAGPQLDVESGRLLTEELWPAVTNDNIETFGQTLMGIQQLNTEALGKVGTPVTMSEEEQSVLDVMRDNGAVAWGKSATGETLYGLVRGATASQDLRKKLREHIGFFGGTILATITDNRGMALSTKEDTGRM